MNLVIATTAVSIESDWSVRKLCTLYDYSELQYVIVVVHNRKWPRSAHAVPRHPVAGVFEEEIEKGRM